jgi:hypothetical protein
MLAILLREAAPTRGLSDWYTWYTWYIPKNTLSEPWRVKLGFDGDDLDQDRSRFFCFQVSAVELIGLNPNHLFVNDFGSHYSRLGMDYNHK